MSAAITPPLSPGSEQHRIWSLWLGDRLSQNGPALLEDHLVQDAAMAVARGVDPRLAAALTDRGRPDPARARAFADIAEALDDIAADDDDDVDELAA